MLNNVLAIIYTGIATIVAAFVTALVAKGVTAINVWKEKNKGTVLYSAAAMAVGFVAQSKTYADATDPVKLQAAMDAVVALHPQFKGLESVVKAAVEAALIIFKQTAAQASTPVPAITP
jgi:tRNA G18 (ribose-2'-O)-methylase SpoU